MIVMTLKLSVMSWVPYHLWQPWDDKLLTHRSVHTDWNVYVQNIREQTCAYNYACVQWHDNTTYISVQYTKAYQACWLQRVQLCEFGTMDRICKGKWPSDHTSFTLNIPVLLPGTQWQQKILHIIVTPGNHSVCCCHHWSIWKVICYQLELGK